MVIRIRVPKSPIFPSWHHFLRCFCRTEHQVDMCITILQTIIDNDNWFPAARWQDVNKSSVGMYTKCLKLLRDNGLVEKRDGHYRLSKDVIYSVRKIPEKWSELVETVEKGDKITLA